MTGLSRDGLHVLLQRRAGPSMVLRVNQSRLADELNISRFALNRVIKLMEQEGRIAPVSGRGSAGSTAKVYTVADIRSWRLPAP